MQENTNKAILINSVILYVRMGIVTICALLTTRYALQALGFVDFGLFSVLGGIISFISIFNTIMLTASNRFISVAVGKGDLLEIKSTFNVLLVVFLTIALFTLFCAMPLGCWYVERFIRYDGDITIAKQVFLVSILGSVISFLGTPYNGILMARERFIVFSFVDVVCHVVRLIVAYLLIYHFESKLLIYSVTLSLTTAVPTIIYYCYCKRYFSESTEWYFVKDLCKYKEILSFSFWIAYGAVACIAKTQGAALLVNAFFNTIMNTALGLANSINSYVVLFANVITQPMAPQITKSYSLGDVTRTDELLKMSIKLSFMMTFLASSPLLVSCDWIMNLWLGNVPQYAVTFTILLVIDNIVSSFNSGVSNLVFATGKIKHYQVIINTIRLLSIVGAYFTLKIGFPAESLLYLYIIFSGFVVIASQLLLKKILKYNNRPIIKEVYIPSLMVVLLFMPVFLLKALLSPFLMIIFSFVYLLVLEFFVGLSKREKKFVKNIIFSKIGCFIK